MCGAEKERFDRLCQKASVKLPTESAAVANQPASRGQREGRKTSKNGHTETIEISRAECLLSLLTFCVRIIWHEIGIQKPIINNSVVCEELTLFSMPCAERICHCDVHALTHTHMHSTQPREYYILSYINTRRLSEINLGGCTIITKN